MLYVSGMQSSRLYFFDCWSFFRQSLYVVVNSHDLTLTISTYVLFSQSLSKASWVMSFAESGSDNNLTANLYSLGPYSLAISLNSLDVNVNIVWRCKSQTLVAKEILYLLRYLSQSIQLIYSLPFLLNRTYKPIFVPIH